MLFYLPEDSGRTVFSVVNFVKDIENGDVEAFMERLQALFSNRKNMGVTRSEAARSVP